jgi:beta-aspartyl-peptidase (threonine type)
MENESIMKNTSIGGLTTVFLLMSLFVSSLIGDDLQAAEPRLAIAIHGGAGTINKLEMTEEKRAKYEQKLQEAVTAGYTLLEQGKSSQEAVIAAIQVLESSPLFNAGKGAVYTFDGKHELDASIMDGKTLNAGAVSGVRTVKSPILLAKKVMDESVHVMLSGEGAELFAAEHGLPLVDNNYFDTDHRYQSLLKAKERIKEAEKEPKDFRAAYESLPVEYKVGTVGAVALDAHGNIAAVTSTGGMTAKRYGRIGDSPIIGAGTYANNDSCAVSATGHGEYFIRYHVAADICARMEYQGLSLEKAANKVVNGVLKEAGGAGGIIAVDRLGNIAMPFNTLGMYRASKSSTQDLYIGIF